MTMLSLLTILLINSILFSNYQILTLFTYFLPNFITNSFSPIKSLQEQSVSIDNVISSQNSRNSHKILGGLHTVHIKSLASGTIQLNPPTLSKPCYCLRSEPIQIPLLLNFTSLSQITYSITPENSDQPPILFNISADALIHSIQPIKELQFDFDFLPPPQRKYHELLSSPALSKTEELFYLPIEKIGTVKLEQALDLDGQKIIIKRSANALEGVKVVNCPTGGFSEAGKELHYCSNPEESVSIGLTVAGLGPLKVNWHENRSLKGGKSNRISKSLEGILLERREFITLPINASLETAGKIQYSLDSIIDSCGNEFRTNDVNRVIVIHSKPQAYFQAFEGKLLDTGGFIAVKVDGMEGRKATVTVKFTPSAGSGWLKDFEIGLNGKIPISGGEGGAGVYHLVGIEGEFCPGIILVPNSLPVEYQPPPSVEISYTPIIDDCQSEIGVVASLKLIGVPPFIIHYSTIHETKTQRFTKRINHSRGEIKFSEFSEPGFYEYKFDKVEDSFYKNVALTSTYSQLLKPTASAKWRKSSFNSFCGDGEDKITVVEVELEGTPPFEIEYSLIGQPSAKISGITKNVYPIEIIPPTQVRSLVLTLESVMDASGCRRIPNAADLVVEIRKAKPTAQLPKSSALIRDDQAVRIPVRLSGASPWTITYNTPSGKILSFTATEPNVDLIIDNPLAGVYKLLTVRDRQCPGELISQEFLVSFLPRPTLSIGSSIRAGVCQGAADSVPLELTGQSPFRITYDLITPRGSSTRSLSAISHQADFKLSTEEPGQNIYHFSLADSNYEQASVRSKELKQTVFGLPRASWISNEPISFCLNQQLSSDTSMISLEGAAPFEVEVEVEMNGLGLESTKKRKERFKLAVPMNNYRLSLPYILSTASTYSITILRVTDSNGCSRNEEVSTLISVFPVASISSLEDGNDYCVGEQLGFELIGEAPFSIHSTFQPINSNTIESHVILQQEPSFSRLASAAGTFKIVSLSHGKDLPVECGVTTTNIVKHIHDLSSVKLERGDSIIDDIREGEKSEIIVSLRGIPPYTFTYGRSKSTKLEEAAVRNSVIETFTVTTSDSKVSIFVAVEGTFSILSVKDRYCSYDYKTGGKRILHK